MDDLDELLWLESNQPEEEEEDFSYYEQLLLDSQKPSPKRPRSNGPHSPKPKKQPKTNTHNKVPKEDDKLFQKVQEENSHNQKLSEDAETEKKRQEKVVEDVFGKENDNEEDVEMENGGRENVVIEDIDEDEEEWLRRDVVKGGEKKGQEKVVEKKVSRFAFEIKGDCVPITGLEGDRVYAKLRGVEEKVGRFDFKTHHHTNSLISEPIHVLLQRVATESFTKAVQASVESQGIAILQETAVVNEKLWVDKYSPRSFMELLSDEQINREVLLWLKQWDTCVFGSEIRSTSDAVLSSLRHHSTVAQQHTNRSYSGNNFSKRNFSGNNFSGNNFSGRNFSGNSFSGRNSSGSNFSGKNFSGSYRESRSGVDNFKGNHHSAGHNINPNGNSQLGNKSIKGSGPPEHKILLLCGPPGLGKTTLAHVAAKHCGYHVVEINASDDRSSSSIEGKILDVVQMNSIMADSKPKCLVIDEIDGALGDGKGAVEVILKMLSAEKKSAAGKENTKNEHGKSSSRKKHKAASLSRPIICICNDLYAPALRPLRQVAQVHTFVQPTVSRVVNRLKYICQKEGLKTSSIALTALAEYTECDIRSCLNTLQFLHKKKETLNMLEIDSQVVGRKDTVKSVFDIWKEIFQKRKVKSDRKLDNGAQSKFRDFDFMHSLVSNRGDYDLILDGVHENILQLNYHDPGMQKTVKCLHTLGASDLIHQYIMRTQHMSLLVYQPTAAVYIRNIVAQNQRPNIEWPKSFHRCRAMLMENMDNFRSWHNKISPYISRHISTKSLVEDSLSSLLHILSPPKLRPVAVHLLSEKEKTDFFQLVNTMVAYSVTYKNLKPDPVFSHPSSGAVGDTSMLSFDPPLANLINFKEYTSGHFVLAAAVKQVLVHEVEKQKILQSSINRSMESTDVGGTGKYTPEGGEIGLPPSSSSISENFQKSKVLLNQKQSKAIAYHAPSVPESTLVTTASLPISSPAEAKKRKNSSFDFFERFKKPGNNSSQQTSNGGKEAATTERDSRPLLFKFNEGYTNAVKRPVRMSEFLL